MRRIAVRVFGVVGGVVVPESIYLRPRSARMVKVDVGDDEM